MIKITATNAGIHIITCIEIISVNSYFSQCYKQHFGSNLNAPVLVLYVWLAYFTKHKEIKCTAIPVPC